MKKIYLNNVFILEIKTDKKELRPCKVIKLINMKHDPEVWGIDLIAELCSPLMKFKLKVWKFFHIHILLRFNDSFLGQFRIWFLDYFFNKDITETFLNQQTFYKESQQLTDFLTEPNTTHLKPVPTLGLLQSLHGKAFKDMTAFQFIESNRCWMMINRVKNQATKDDAINELIAYMYIPKIAWQLPFLGVYVRAYLLQDSFIEKRKKLAQKLDPTAKVLLIEYYAQNLELLQKTYKEFYSGGKTQDGQLDIVTQYFSMKNLVQLRSPNLIPSKQVSMMQIIDLLDSYETEMRVAAEKLKQLNAQK